MVAEVVAIGSKIFWNLKLDSIRRDETVDDTKASRGTVQRHRENNLQVGGEQDAAFGQAGLPAALRAGRRGIVRRERSELAPNLHARQKFFQIGRLELPRLADEVSAQPTLADVFVQRRATDSQRLAHLLRGEHLVHAPNIAQKGDGYNSEG